MKPGNRATFLMSRVSLLAISAAMAASSEAVAAYNVSISTNPTSNGSISSCVFTPTGNNAVLNYQDLQTSLASCSTQVTTGSAGSQGGNITVAAGVSWSNGSTLTLDAYKSVTVNASIAVAGTGGLTLKTNDGGANGALSFGSSGDATFAQTSSALTINGTGYILINSVAQLASAVANNNVAHIALANSYDASGDGTYTSAPVNGTFDGVFEGLGNTISKLSLNDTSTTDNVGLFSALGVVSVHIGTIRDFVLSNSNVTASGAYVGGLVGIVQTSAVLTNDTVNGISISASGAGVPNVGGLAGSNGGTISNALLIGSCLIAMSPPANGDAGEIMGGLAGSNSGSISGSSVGNAVTVLSQNNGELGGAGKIQVGGLVGSNSGTVSSSNSQAAATSAYDSTSITTPIEVGGLAANNAGGTIQNSFASGPVTGEFEGGSSGGGIFGGLVGVNSATITNSYATGNVSGDNSGTYASYVGGLVGQNDGIIQGSGGSTSWASGNVSGGSGSLVGGLVGATNTGAIIQYSYSTGTASATTGGEVGGLVGMNIGAIAYSYYAPSASNTVVQTGNLGLAGGLAGGNVGTIKYSWVTNYLVNESGSAPLILGGDGSLAGGSSASTTLVR